MEKEDQFEGYAPIERGRLGGTGLCRYLFSALPSGKRRSRGM